MIRLAISPTAYAAIACPLPGNVNLEPQLAPTGYCRVWLDRSCRVNRRELQRHRCTAGIEEAVMPAVIDTFPADEEGRRIGRCHCSPEPAEADVRRDGAT
jgi:hypothetical protein